MYIQHFELTSNDDILEAQNALASEIGPEVEKLLNLTEQYVAKLERRERGLVSKAELQEGRLTNFKARMAARDNRSGNVDRADRRTLGSGGNTSEANREKLKMLKAKKQRIQYAVERLEMEGKQKTRQMKTMGIEGA